MREGGLLLLSYNVFYTCNVNYDDCSIRVYRSFGMNFPYFYKYISSYAGIMLDAFIGTYYAGIISGSLDWQHRK